MTGFYCALRVRRLRSHPVQSLPAFQLCPSSISCLQVDLEAGVLRGRHYTVPDFTSIFRLPVFSQRAASTFPPGVTNFQRVFSAGFYRIETDPGGAAARCKVIALGKINIRISPSERDEPLVRPLAGWLQSGLGLAESDIRCTVVTNMAVGSLPADVLREDLKCAKAVIGLLTANSLRSHWAQLEMGAGWLHKRLHPIRGPGIHATDLPSPLSDFTAVGYCEQAGMQNLLRQLADILGASVSRDAEHEFEQIAKSAEDGLQTQRVCWFSLPAVLSASRIDSVRYNYELLSLCSELGLQPGELRSCTTATGVITRDPEQLPLWASDLWAVSKNAINFILSPAARNAEDFLDVPQGVLNDRLIADMTRALHAGENRARKMRQWFSDARDWIAANPPGPRRVHGSSGHYHR